MCRTKPLCLFWTIWKERNRRSFENMELSVQRMKFLFLCSLLSWTNLFIKHTFMFLVDFIDWWGGIEGWSIFVFPILFGSIRRPLYTPCVHWCTPFFGVLIQFALTYQKNIYMIETNNTAS